MWWMVDPALWRDYTEVILGEIQMWIWRSTLTVHVRWKTTLKDYMNTVYHHYYC